MKRNISLLSLGLTSLLHRKEKYLFYLVILGYMVFYLGKQCAEHDARHGYNTQRVETTSPN
ncbi:hypothetical protein ACT4R9_02140 [Ornithobacterium rhinotracheale]|uniref:hypothetical protein n=1 Tax=Ornithobacterium rhinotracheale TaxID=28251 RepID=UPI003FA4256A